MGKADLAAYEKQVDKLCASCLDDVLKELTSCKNVIKKRIETLAKEIKGVRVPKALTDDELNEIPGKLGEILKKHNAAVNKVLQVTVDVKVDEQKKTVQVTSYGLSGGMAGI